MNRSLLDVTSSEALAHGLLAGLKGKATIKKDDVAALRASDIAVGLTSTEAAAALIAIECGPADKCRDWSDFLIEALLDFVVWGDRPTGIVTEQQAAWLLDQVGERPTPACMALLISVIDEAHAVPHWFHVAVRLRASKAFSGVEGQHRHAA